MCVCVRARLQQPALNAQLHNNDIIKSRHTHLLLKSNSENMMLLAKTMTSDGIHVLMS